MDFPPDLIAALASAQRVTVLTGSGVSRESGVPTFRDAQTGLWAKFRPEELATPGAFRRHPDLVWEWYLYRRKQVGDAVPNPAHIALAAMAKFIPTFTLITQNVDGLHQRAGSRDVIELHGNITRTKCSEEDIVVTAWVSDGETPPRCPRCGAMLRPDVVWFEEPLPPTELERAIARSDDCDVFLSIGTSAVVYPAADLPLRALERGAMLVEINRAPTPISTKAHHVVSAPAAEVLPHLAKQIAAARHPVP